MRLIVAWARGMVEGAATALALMLCDVDRGPQLASWGPTLRELREALTREQNAGADALRIVSACAARDEWKREADELRRKLHDYEHTIEALKDAIQSCGRSCISIAWDSGALERPKVGE